MLGASSQALHACIDGCDEHPPIVALAGTRNLRDVLDDVARGRDVGTVDCGIAHRTERLWRDATFARRASPRRWWGGRSGAAWPCAWRRSSRWKAFGCTR